VVIGSDHVYPRESNRVMRDLIESNGGDVIGEHYLPLDAPDEALKALVEEIRRLAPDAVFSTVVVQAPERFYRFYADAGIDRRRHPIASLTFAEDQIHVVGPERCSGHILAAPYVPPVGGLLERRNPKIARHLSIDRPASRGG
jgi:urea transport system substrate-binding protein